MNDTLTTAQRNEIAAIIGESPETIKRHDARWSQLLKEGVIVRLTLRRWRGRAKLDLADIGIPINGEEKLYGDLLDLGEKLLLPKDLIRELDSIDSAARKCVERHGFETYWGIFIPASAFQSWKAEDARYAERYLAVRDKIVEDWDTILDGLLTKYAEVARIAYRRRNKLQASIDKDWRFTDEDAFVDAFLTHLRTLIPSREQIRTSFGYETDISYIPLPSLLAEEVALAEEAKARALAARASISEEQRRAELRDEMHRQVLRDAAEAKGKLIDSFLKDIVKQLRAAIYDAVVTVGDSIQRNDYLHPRSVVQLQNLVAQVAKLNFFGDKDADAMIAELRRIVDTPAENRSTGEIQTQLGAIATITRSTLIALGDSPRAARSLGVVDNPSAEVVRQARTLLGLDDQPTLGLERQARNL